MIKKRRRKNFSYEPRTQVSTKRLSSEKLIFLDFVINCGLDKQIMDDHRPSASTLRDMISWNFNLSRAVSFPPSVTTLYDGGSRGRIWRIYRILWSLTAVWDRVTVVQISINDIEVETSKGLISHSPLPSQTSQLSWQLGVTLQTGRHPAASGMMLELILSLWFDVISV